MSLAGPAADPGSSSQEAASGWYYEKLSSIIQDMCRLVAVLVLCSWLPAGAMAHELQHRIDRGEAVFVRFSYPDGSDFSFESYEVYRAGEESPFQVGKTDEKGRVAFLPDRAGTWRVEVFSEDGHGTQVSFSTPVAGDVRDRSRSFFERHLRIVVGVSVIFGLFGLVSLAMRRGRER